MEKEIKCKNCGKIVVAKSNKRQFCGVSCRNKYYYIHNENVRAAIKKSSLEYYRRKAQDPEWRKKRYEYFKKWIQNHRENFNAIMRRYYHKRKNIKVKEVTQP